MNIDEPTTHNAPSNLDPESDWAPADYLRAFRREASPSPQTKKTNLAAIERRGEMAREPDHAVPQTRWAAGLFVVKMSALSLVLGGIGLGGVAVVARLASAPDPKPEITDAAAAPPAADPPRALARASTRGQGVAEPTPVPATGALPDAAVARRAGSAGAPLPPEGGLPVARPARGSTGQANAAVPTAPDALQVEIKLLRAARAHMDDALVEEAIALLDEHARRFPKGALTQERQAWRAIAACRSVSKAGRTRALAFVSAYPASPLVAKVRSACALEKKP